MQCAEKRQKALLYESNNYILHELYTKHNSIFTNISNIAACFDVPIKDFEVFLCF